MAAAQVSFPQVEVFNRVLGLPVVEQALAVSALTYSKFKDSNQFIHWFLSYAEDSITQATRQAVPYAAPIAMKLETPIHFVDDKLCWGLNKIEEKVPIVKETPEMIFEKSYMFALQTVQPAVSRIAYANDLIISQANSLKELSWNKANQLLGSHYGIAAIHGLDSTASVVDKVIDRYFPPTGTEIITEPTSSEEDALLHTLQTVGRLSNKAARRVYGNVVHNLRTINKDKMKLYVSNIVEFLQLTRYIHAVNDKVQKFTSPAKETANKKAQSTNGHAKCE